MQICPNWIFICSCVSDVKGAVFCKQGCMSQRGPFQHPGLVTKKKKELETEHLLSARHGGIHFPTYYLI